ncbi:lantibiotic dehydratase [Hymenobacter persicinus]|uniref:Lantibiotic dehydratase n=1 Tax=Hymenobacter persicinus TaxID=2025506 RepID=A0A4Q5LIF7_9BACT|nr:lantibiotic dehydratase [Hymenobacter persicinus]RYU82782.1 hypothetical protein EWM57_03580 [Hymenobacter persicinus]
MLFDCGFFFLRTPALPYGTIDELTSEKLRALCDDPYVREAIFVASPDLFAVFEQWRQGALTDPKDLDRLELTVAKYLLRMSYRSTPFGLFAGVSRGDLTAGTDLQLVGPAQYEKHVRLDMDYLCALALSIARDPAIREQLLYWPNTTLYSTADSTRLVEYKVFNKVRTHHLVSLERTSYLDKALARAATGATIRSIAQHLTDEDVTLEEAESYVHELVGSQVIVSRLEPVLTGASYLQTVISVLTPLPGCAELVAHLTTLDRSLTELGQQPSAAALPLYKNIAAQLSTLGVSFELGQLFQVDLRKPTLGHTLNVAVVDEVRKAIDLVSRLNRHEEADHLTKFKEAFRAKYDQAEVALVQVLDSEMGLGYPLNSASVSDNTPLLQGIVVDSAAAATTKTYRWTEWRKFLLDSYLETLRTGSPVLTLTAEAVAPYLQQIDAATLLPASCYSMVTLVAESAAAVDAGQYQVLHHGTDGPSAARLLGRFSYLDATLTAQLRECLDREAAAYPEAVLAEIVHINQSRMGNVVIRPQLRAYEIPIMVQAGVDEEHCIPLDDLLLSLHHNTLVLRSKRLGKHVIPRLSTAHNYGFNTLPAYRLLCDLQHQDQMLNCRWDWGVLNEADFLPRVEFGKVILARARWMLSTRELQQFRDAKAELSFMAELRQTRRLPRWVTYKEGDNELPFDLDNPLSVKLLKSLLKNSTTATLEERLVQTPTGAVQSPDGSFLNEFIIPLHNPHFRPTLRPAAKRPDPASVVRQFPVGSEWLYLKLYCGVKMADKLLLEYIKPVVEELTAAGVVEQWFFIRYADPNHHLRLRFRGRGPFFATVLSRLQQVLEPLLHDAQLTDYYPATYQRELERYGWSTIEHSEAMFWQDSQAVVDILALLDEGEAGDELRWQIALRGVDALLTDFKLTTAERKALFDGLQERSKTEFDAHSAVARKSLGHRYRQERAKIAAILQQPLTPQDELYPVGQLLATRSRNWQPQVDHIRCLAHDGQLTVGYTPLLESFIHMFLNRIFRSQQRMQEMVLYDFLHQAYASQLAQQRTAPPALLPA